MNIGCVYYIEDFVSVEKPLPSLTLIPFGISFIATSLKHSGYNPIMIVFTPQTDIYEVVNKFVIKYRPTLFCLTAVTSQYHIICDIAKSIKNIDSAIYVLLGGHHATLNPNKTIRNPNFDAICIGEGERAVLEYASRIKRNKKPAGINNLWIRNKGGNYIEKNPQNSFIQDIDNLPFIERRMWDKWVADKVRMPAILIGRGCPHKCTYCSNHAIAKVSNGKYVRFRSPENVVNELNEIVKHYPSVNSVYLEVETFGANLEYMYNMCDHLKRFLSNLGRNISFGVNIAITRKVVNNGDLLRKLKSANFSYINIGLESGSERIRNEILKRPKYSNNDIISFCKLAKKYKIKINLFVLLAIPGETKRDFKETIAIVRGCNPEHVFLSIFYPYPGTDLYRTAKKMKIISDGMIDPGLERKKAVLDLPGFSKKQIQLEYLLFPYKAYKGRKPIGKILANILRTYIGMNPKVNSFYRRANMKYKLVRSLQIKLKTTPI